MNGLGAALRTVAEVIGEGHEHSGPEGPMSDRVEIGLSRLTPAGWMIHQRPPPTPGAEIVAETAPERLLWDLSPECKPEVWPGGVG